MTEQTSPESGAIDRHTASSETLGPQWLRSAERIAIRHQNVAASIVGNRSKLQSTALSQLLSRRDASVVRKPVEVPAEDAPRAQAPLVRPRIASGRNAALQALTHPALELTYAILPRNGARAAGRSPSEQMPPAAPRLSEPPAPSIAPPPRPLPPDFASAVAEAIAPLAAASREPLQQHAGQIADGVYRRMRAEIAGAHRRGAIIPPRHAM